MEISLFSEGTHAQLAATGIQDEHYLSRDEEIRKNELVIKENELRKSKKRHLKEKLGEIPGDQERAVEMKEC